MPDRGLIENVREILATRALAAGMEYDPADMVETYHAGTTYLFLRCIRHPEYDDEGQFVRWRYEELVQAIFREVRKAGPTQLQVTSFGEVRVLARCPWLMAKVTDDGEVTIGN